MNRKALLIIGGIIAVVGFLSFTKQGRTVATKVGRMISDNGLEMLKRFEKFSSKAYWDVKGWSIGFGHFMGPTKTMDNISLAQGLELLKQDLNWVENAIKKYIKVPLTQNQHDALTSLVYNIGEPNFAKSTVVKKLNAGDNAGAADAFMLFNKVRDKAGNLVVSEYQTNRRSQERQLFIS